MQSPHWSKHPYLTRQLIAYIGNKRRLLPLIRQAIESCGLPPGTDVSFADLFAGSGAVSRLARFLGYRVLANDWEPYAAVLNRAFLTTDAAQLPNLYQEWGGLEQVLSLLNGLQHPSPAASYVSRYYCPRSTEQADPDQERLFYTRENGERIDAIREWIETNYPGTPATRQQRTEKDLLLGLLLYEAATHANTSGVFKAYHRGFGGRGGDALKRILGRIGLEFPALWNGPAQVYCMDALQLAHQWQEQGTRIDIAYLDPPYNQHQYGSNYHMLNTIALNDKPPISNQIMVDGRVQDKAGIRRDWVRTRSSYCYRTQAEASFAALINALPARYILVSYSTEGIIPFPTLVDILNERGRVDIVFAPYTRYRGGKQALTSTLSNLEFVLVVDTGCPGRKQEARQVLATLDCARFEVLANRPVSPTRLVEAGFRMKRFTTLDEDMVLAVNLDQQLVLELSIHGFKHIAAWRILNQGQEVSLPELNPNQLQLALHVMDRITDVDRSEELHVTLNRIRYLEEAEKPDDILSALPDLPYLLKKFNDRKAYLASLQASVAILHTLTRLKARCLLRLENVRTARVLQKLKGILDLKLALLHRATDAREAARLQHLIQDACRSLFQA